MQINRNCLIIGFLPMIQAKRYCQCVLKYQFENGLSFILSENLLILFSHVIELIEHRIHSSTHISTSPLKKNLSKEQEVLNQQSEEAVINCVSTAFLGYKVGLSYSTFIFTEIHYLVEMWIWKIIQRNTVGNVDLKNYSK